MRDPSKAGVAETASPAPPAGLQLMFPGNPAYARRYLTRKDGKGLAFTWESEELLARAVASMAGPTPPGMDRDEGLATLSETARRALEAKEAFFVKGMRRAFPPLEGEELVEEFVTVLREPWGPAPRGAVLYRRTTDFGTLIVTDGTTIVSPDGSIALNLPPPLPHALPHLEIRAADSSSGMSTLKPVLSLVQMVLFACGPAGIIGAAGLGALELIFSSGDDKPELPKVINDLVEQDFANDHVKTDLAVIVGYAKWLSEQNAKAMSGQMPEKSQKEYADALAQLKEYIVNACDPGSQLMTAISNLQNGTYTSDPPYQVIGLPALLLGAALHLTFEKARLLFSTDATTFKSPLAYNIVNAAKDYVQYIDDTAATIESAFTGRLNAVSQLTQGDFSEFVEGDDTGGRSVTRHYAYIADSNAGKYPQQPVLVPSSGGSSSGYAPNIVWCRVCMPKGCSGDATCDSGDLDPGTSWRTAYLSSINASLAAKYNADDARRKEIAAARAGFQKIVDTYQQAAPPERI